MNIFVTSSCPEKSAIRLWKNPIRARKMITESQQLLAVYIHEKQLEEQILKVNGEKFSIPKSVLGHKITKWLLKNKLHFEWLVDHLEYLYNQYNGNGFKNVKNNINILRKYTSDNYEGKYNNIIFYNYAAAKDKNLDFRNVKNVFKAYDLYLKAQDS